MFGDPEFDTTVLDRMLYHGHLVTIRLESY
ncbi:hypothetical protein [Paraburkholderia sp. J69-1]